MSASDSRACFWYATAATLGAAVGRQGWQKCAAANVIADARGSSNAERAELQRQARADAQRRQWQWQRQRQQEYRSWKNADADARFQESVTAPAGALRSIRGGRSGATRGATAPRMVAQGHER